MSTAVRAVDWLVEPLTMFQLLKPLSSLLLLEVSVVLVEACDGLEAAEAAAEATVEAAAESAAEAAVESAAEAAVESGG